MFGNKNILLSVSLKVWPSYKINVFCYLFFKYWKFSKIAMFIKIKNYTRTSFSVNFFSYFKKRKDTFFPPGNRKYCFNNSYAYIFACFLGQYTHRYFVKLSFLFIRLNKLFDWFGWILFCNLVLQSWFGHTLMDNFCGVLMFNIKNLIKRPYR